MKLLGIILAIHKCVLNSEEYKNKRMEAALFFFTRYEKDRDKFLNQTVTGGNKFCTKLQKPSTSQWNGIISYLHQNPKNTNTQHTESDGDRVLGPQGYHFD